MYGSNQGVSTKQSSLDGEGGVILRDRKGAVLKAFTKAELDHDNEERRRFWEEADRKYRAKKKERYAEREPIRTVMRKHHARTFEGMQEHLKEMGLTLEKQETHSYARNGRYTNTYTKREYVLSNDKKEVLGTFSTLMEVADYMEESEVSKMETMHEVYQYDK